MHRAVVSAAAFAVATFVMVASPTIASAQEPAQQSQGTHTPGSGFQIADTPQGALNIRVWAYLRYLNQMGLDDQYVDAFGVTKRIRQRQDVQLNNAGSLVWMPTTGEFGPASGFGDFEGHQSMATRLGIRHLYSDEDRQSQPDTEAIENAQIRISDGNIVFTPGLFGEGINISDVVVHTTSFDAGVKYRGFALEGEYYWRMVDNIRGTNVERLAFDDLHDHGFQLQASAMLKPRTLQLYLSGSKIFGEYGDPSEWRTGVSVFPRQNQVVRWNTEVIHLNASPVGALSLPYTVGGNGPVFYNNLEVNF